MSAPGIIVRWTLDYGEHYASMLAPALEADREKLIAYGSIIEEKGITEDAVKVYVVEYDHPGWEARGLVEETQTEIGHHASFEKVSEGEEWSG